MPKQHSVTIDLGHAFIFPVTDHNLPFAIGTEAALASRKFLDQGGYRVKQEQEQLLTKYKVTVTVTEEEGD